MLGRIVPIYMAQLLGDFRSLVQNLRTLDETLLNAYFKGLLYHSFHSIEHHLCAHFHKSVVHVGCAVLRLDYILLAQHDFARIHAFVYEE